MHHHRHRWLPAEVGRSADAPVVCIQTVWPLFGRRPTLNAATYCATMSTVSAGQQRNRQLADVRDTVYGSDAWCRARTGRMRIRTGLRPGPKGATEGLLVG